MIFITFVVDKVGRKKPLVIGIIGIVIALICEGALNSQNEAGDKEGLSIAGVAFIFTVSVIFSFSFGPVSWTYMSEVLPYQVRSKGAAFATGIGNWLVATFWAQVSPTALEKLGWKFYFIFVGELEPYPLARFGDFVSLTRALAAFDLVITLPCLILLFKETKGMSLEEIDIMFGGRALGTLADDMEKNTAEASAVHEGHEDRREKVA